MYIELQCKMLNKQKQNKFDHCNFVTILQTVDGVTSQFTVIITV